MSSSRSFVWHFSLRARTILWGLECISGISIEGAKETSHFKWKKLRVGSCNSLGSVHVSHMLIPGNLPRFWKEFV
ncbi:hypothetical protein SLEP1_g39035 [Rubroshorea leprosula]|uniref:Uncharacterized protein n=1 Tax=Rubroshorea leprosula TaxID=152421 RepID=A0AAV5KZP3_9ROSI|nr:hypothetical protein SLEP1_g39035 [Rubroshorea leprosula]